MNRKKAIIMGAAGRDFHEFNAYFRDNEEFEVVCFTAEQIPGIDGRTYPKELSGKLYPKGIPIYPESDLPKLIKEKKVDLVFFSYSDVSFNYLMQRASIALAGGATFSINGPGQIQLKSSKPVIAVNATRTGTGKSQTTRYIAEIMKKKGKKIVVIREPMPYGDLVKQAVMRFGKYEDLEKNKCTIEEMEEYEPHIMNGNIVYAGVDYERIIREAEKEAEVVLWDGGNNELSFYETDALFVVADPFRVGHELSYHPGMSNLLIADAVIINKVNTAERKKVEELKENIRKYNPNAKIIEANSTLIVEGNEELKGKKVLCVEDGPTLTHGGMNLGAAYMAAKQAGAEIVNPKPFAVGEIKKTFEKYPHLKDVLPAMGYGGQQVKDLEETIKKVECDIVLVGTPIDLKKIVKTDRKMVRVKYDLEEVNPGEIEAVIDEKLES
ncbi:GTPase [Candidatus Micrarchaeota archaeon]|nr:GTPase [Candidatus Micrarchaeota archaeon]